MNELYEAIEKKIKDAGYPRNISGADVYDDICDQIDGKDKGEYILLSKFEDDVVFEYHITIQEEDYYQGYNYASWGWSGFLCYHQPEGDSYIQGR